MSVDKQLLNKLKGAVNNLKESWNIFQTFLEFFQLAMLKFK